MKKLHKIEQIILDFISEFHPRGLLLACSGGGDSMALFYAVNQVKSLINCKIEIVTVDHNLREESSEEAEFIKTISQEQGYVHHLFRIDKPLNKSENYLRTERRKIFSLLMKERGLDFTVLAHTANDQAETILMRLIRGSGLEGVSGMQVLSPPYWRPFLFVKRSDLRKYLKSKNLTWFEDKSNFSDVYFRNRVRNQIIPLLKQENPNIIDSLMIFSQNVHRDLNIIDNLTNQVFNTGVYYKTGKFFLLSEVIKYGEEILFYLIKKTWRNLSNKSEINFKHINSSIQLIKKGTSGNRIHLPNNIIIIKVFDGFYIGKNIDITKFEVEISNLDTNISIPRGEIKLKPSNLGEIRISNDVFPLKIRNRRKNDVLKRKHFGNVKLSSLMKDKIPVILRDELIIIENTKGEIEWVEELGRSFKENYSDLPGFDLIWLKENYPVSKLLKKLKK